MVDIVSYIIGKKDGEKTVTIESDNYVFSDDGVGNVTIEEEDNGEQTA